MLFRHPEDYYLFNKWKIKCINFIVMNVNWINHFIRSNELSIIIIKNEHKKYYSIIFHVIFWSNFFIPLSIVLCAFQMRNRFEQKKKILARCDWITNYNVFRKKKMKKSANKNVNENVHERRITEKMSTEQTTLTQRKSNRTQCTLNAELHLYILHWFGWQ